MYVAMGVLLTLWTIYWWWTGEQKKNPHISRGRLWLLRVGFAGIVALGIFLAAWPLTWEDV